MKRLCTVLLSLIGCTTVFILCYSLLIMGTHKSSRSLSINVINFKPSVTHPIERPRTVNGDGQQQQHQHPQAVGNADDSHLTPHAHVLLERYNEFDVKSRLLRDKIQRLTVKTFIGHNQDDVERLRHQPQHEVHNVSTRHVHIFYSAPVMWYKDINNNKEEAHVSRHLRDAQGNSEADNIITVTPLNSVFYPKLGIYSITTQILDIHFRNIYEAGIQVIVVHWVPSQSLDIIKHMMNYARQMYDTRMSIAIELGSYQGRTAETVLRDLNRLRDEFVWTHPNMYRVMVASRQEWLPMVYVQSACVGIEAEAWANIFGPKHKGSVRHGVLDAVFIGEASNKKDTSLIRRGFFNGFYSRTASNGATYTSTWKNWDVLKQTADKYHLLFVPTVAPGYNERKKEPATGGMRRQRSNGQYYGVAWRTAISLAPQFISVASYNDWPAGTQIEEAIPFAGHKDYQPTGPRKYLDLTKHWVEQFVHGKQSDNDQSCTAFFNNTIC